STSFQPINTHISQIPRLAVGSFPLIRLAAIPLCPSRFVPSAVCLCNAEESTIINLSRTVIDHLWATQILTGDRSLLPPNQRLGIRVCKSLLLLAVAPQGLTEPPVQCVPERLGTHRGS